MRLRDFPLLTDENLAPIIVAFLRREGFDVLDVAENGWRGEDDGILLQRATARGRVVITQDGDFGTLAIRDRNPFVGIVRLRPGHLAPSQSIDLIEELLQDDPDVDAPFLIVVRLTATGVKIRTLLVAP